MPPPPPRPRILTVAGSDSGGGAGIQADLKAITCLGGFGMSAITALTAQNTVGVLGVHPVPQEFVALQIRACAEDIGVDAAKTGMLGGADVVEAVAEALGRVEGLKLVVDPVMVAKSGDRLLAPEAESALAEKLLPLAWVVTPNRMEAEVLAGFEAGGLVGFKGGELEGAREAARRIHALGPRYVLVKGGHLDLGMDEAVDILFDGERFEEFGGPRLPGRNTHGTGCTLSAALATELGRGLDAPEAVLKAKRFVSEAIRHGLPLGQGHGPTDPLAAAKATGAV